MRPRRRSHAARLPGLASWASVACLGLLATGAHGGEAVRYRDGQGIEMIGGRATVVPAAPFAPPALATQRIRQARLPIPPHQQQAAMARPQVSPHEQQAASVRLQIPPHEQQARDRDRLAILRQELDAELAAAHASIADSRGLAHEPLQRAREQLRRHQQNIRDLNAEISRTLKALK